MPHLSIAHDVVSDILDIAERFKSQHALENALRILDGFLALDVIRPSHALTLTQRAERLVDHFTALDVPVPPRPFLVFDSEASTRMTDA